MTIIYLISILKFLFSVLTPERKAMALVLKTLESAKLGIDDFKIAFLLSFLQHPIKGKFEDTKVPIHMSSRAVMR